MGALDALTPEILKRAMGVVVVLLIVLSIVGFAHNVPLPLLGVLGVFGLLIMMAHYLVTRDMFLGLHPLGYKVVAPSGGWY